MNPGSNEIRRRSEQSSVTIPYERSFRRIGSEYQPKNNEELAKFQFCGCGWPAHMLLPKGTAAGTKFDIFVMVSDYEHDRVDQVLNRYLHIFTSFYLHRKLDFTLLYIIFL